MIVSGKNHVDTIFVHQGGKDCPKIGRSTVGMHNAGTINVVMHQNDAPTGIGMRRDGFFQQFPVGRDIPAVAVKHDKQRTVATEKVVAAGGGGTIAVLCVGIMEMKFVVGSL